ncbi:MAG: alpha/beta fold hydrolase [Nitrospinota bacterium]|nr:alpha/beta fold hydrolase [Nitrospinota bacterium]
MRRMSSPKIIQEDHFIDGQDPGIRLHIREKRPRGLTRFEEAGTILLLHGQSMTAPHTFDIRLPGYSWMDYLALRGFDVFALTIRGYGLSSRQPELSAPRLANPPAGRGHVALRDIDAAVRFVLGRRSLGRINLLGYSFSTTTSAAYTAANGARIRRLVLYAPFYAYERPEVAVLSEDPRHPGRLDPKFGAWRWVTRREQMERWDGSIPRGQHKKWREARAVKYYWEEQLKFDPEGRKRRVPAVKVPNGPLADRYDRARGVPLYDASKIKIPVLLIRGDHDRGSLDPEANGLYKALTASRGKRHVIIGDATHFIQFERRHEELYGEVRLFLEG